MIVVSISNWRKKVIIISSIMLLMATMSIGFIYHKDSTAAVEMEEMLQEPVLSGMENVESNELEVCDELKNEAQNNEILNDKSLDNGNIEENSLEQEFEEKEMTKGFLEKILEKFRK